MTNTTLSRRRLLANSMPAIAAAAAIAPVAATAAFPADITALLQGRPEWQIRAIASMADMLPQDHDEARTVLKAICESIECSMRARNADAELLALKPQFDEIFAKWCWRVEASRLDRQDINAEIVRRTGLTREQGSKLEGAEHEAFRTVTREISKTASRRLPLETDEECDAWCTTLYATIDEVLSHAPVTRDGLAMQGRATLMDNYSDWRDWRTPAFVASVVLYLNMELPDWLMEDLLAATEAEEV